jgi:IclR family transcriptional regulator, KDG regulon repressor
MGGCPEKSEQRFTGAIMAAEPTSTVDRAFILLRYLAHNPGWHGVRPLGAALDLSPSTTFRLLDALCRSGFAQQDADSGRYAIGPGAVQLGLAALAALDLTSVAPSTLDAIATETGESCFLAVLDEGMVVYLLKREGGHAIRTTAMLGTRRPVHCTALGKTFLAFMPADEARAIVEMAGMPAFTPNTITDLPRLWEELAQIRLDGFAVDREEIETGLTCLAAPVRDHTGRQVAAVSVAGPTIRIAPHQERLGRRIVAAGLEISQALGYTPPAPVAPNRGKR